MFVVMVRCIACVRLGVLLFLLCCVLCYLLLFGLVWLDIVSCLRGLFWLGLNCIWLFGLVVSCFVCILFNSVIVSCGFIIASCLFTVLFWCLFDWISLLLLCFYYWCLIC